MALEAGGIELGNQNPCQQKNFSTILAFLLTREYSLTNQSDRLGGVMRAWM
jgi:hypothetical protein